MAGLLIDYEDVIHPDFKLLLGQIKSRPTNINGYLGLILIISKKQLDSLEKQKDKKSYINTPQFVKSIKASYYIICNFDKKICEIPEKIPDNHLQIILNLLISDNKLSSNMIIWTGVFNFKEDLDYYFKQGFDNPYICDKSPLGYKCSVGHGIALFKKNVSDNKTSLKNTENIKNKVQYIEKQFGKENCKLYSKLSPSAIKYLKTLTTPTPTLNKDGSTSQKEFSGALTVGKIIKNNNKIVFEMVEDISSVKAGVEEEVDAVWNRYNFHTHPKDAYIRNGVKNGWPSSQDYIGFFNLNHHTIFHLVITLEGIYVISFSPEWIDNKPINHNKVIKFIEKNYDIDHLENITFHQYVDEINQIKFKGSPIFIVQYIPWGNAGKIFPVVYAKNGLNCLVTEDMNQNIKKYT